MNNTIEVVPYNDSFRQDVLNLIVTIQQNEFSIPITANDQPDLNIITAYYQNNHGNFWVATLNETIIGTIALINIGNNQAALRKMFVSKNFRGAMYDTANLLLKNLLEWAYAHNFKEIFLGTTAKFLAAHKFYEKNGFLLINKTDLPDNFPIMDVDVKFYKYLIKSSPMIATM